MAIAALSQDTTLHLPDLNLGLTRVRWDFVLVVFGTGLVSALTRGDPVGGATVAGALALAIVIHELGHALVARAAGGRGPVVLQLTGGGTYLSDLPGPKAQSAVLLAGPAAGVLTFALGHALAGRFEGQYLAYFGGYLRFMAALWSIFQLLPFPPLDGGLLLRRVILGRLGSATTAWRLGWVLGFAAVLLLVSLEPRIMEAAVWLTGMTVLLGRAEAGYVRHVDAFSAWQRGEYKDVVRRVRSLPDYLEAADKVGLLELGVAAAIELEDEAAVEDLVAKLPAAHASCVKAAEWLLRRGRPFGARLAEQAFDALDAERVTAAQIHRADWADLAFRLAIFEAEALKDSSALGLLERATALGYDDLDRIEAEGAFDRIRENPRWHEVLAGIRSAL